MSETAATILVADDNENDRWLFQKAFKAALPTLSVDFVRDGQEVIDHLATNPMPCLLVLDHNMTRLNAFGVLKWLHDDETLKHLPVVIVSGTKSADAEGKAQIGRASCRERV